jgi:hypothetical protein
MSLVVFVSGVVLASSAQAEPAPLFSIGGARLATGRTHNFDAKATEEFVLKSASGSDVITCAGFGSVGGVLLGSAEGTHGSTSLVAVLSGCELEGNGSACHLAPSEGSAETTEVITTNPIRGEEVENVEGTHGGKQLLDAFFPVSKALGFVKLNFGGTCTLQSTIVGGSKVAEVVLDNAGEGKIELGQTAQERTSWKVRFPSTPITKVWLVSGGVGKEVETGGTAFNEASIMTGVVLVLLASTKYEPERATLWSPLP